MANETCGLNHAWLLLGALKSKDIACNGNLLPRIRGGWSLQPTLGGRDWPTSAGMHYSIFFDWLFFIIFFKSSI